MTNMSIPSNVRQSPEDVHSVGALVERAAVWVVPLFLLAWGLRAIWIDDSPSDNSNSVCSLAGLLINGLRHGGASSIQEALFSKNPPLSVLISAAVAAVFGNSPTVLRFGGLVCYAVMLWQTFDLTRRVGGDRRVAIWAVLFCGITPLMFGWSRLAYPDAYVPVFVIGCLQVMVRGHLNRRRAVLLGLLAGLGLLTKLTFLVTIVVPCLWFVLGHRQPRHWFNLALAGGVCLLVAGWWYVVAWDTVTHLFARSTQAIVTDTAPMSREATFWLRKLAQAKLYVWQLHGTPGIWLLALVGLLLAGGQGRRAFRSLLGWASLGSLGFWLMFDADPRYLLPMVPPAAVLGGLAVGRVLDLGWLRRLRPLAAGTLATACLGWFCWLNLVQPPVEDARWAREGMLVPNPWFAAACAELRRHESTTEMKYGADGLLEEILVGVDEPGRVCAMPRSGSKPNATCRVDVGLSGPDSFLQQAHIPTAEAGKGCPDPKVLMRFGQPEFLQFMVVPLPEKAIDPDLDRVVEKPN